MKENSSLRWRQNALGCAELTIRKGSLLIEVLLGITLFGMFASAFFLTLLTGQESSRTGSARIRGVYYTEQALEVAKAIRDAGWTALQDGKHGYTLSLTGSWLLTGSALSRYDYDTYIIVDDSVSDVKKLHARSAWKHGYFRSGATVLSLEITNWRSDNGIGDWSSPTQAGSITFPATINFNEIIVYKDYAYVTSNVGTEGDGLYIFDISNPASPTRASSLFSLPGTTHDLVAYRDRLYVIVDDGSDAEIKTYNILSPTALNGSTGPIAEYNLPGGNDRGRALAKDESVLFAAADGNAAQSEFYSFGIQSGNSILPLDELNLASDPNINDIYIRDDFAFLATDKDTEEIIVVDVSDPTDLQVHGIFNASSVEDGIAVRFFATGTYLGRATGASDEYTLTITSGGGLISANPAKTFGANMGGGVNSLDIDPLGCYAFMATSHTSKELQIRSARHKSIDEESTDDLTTGQGRGIYYDVVDDRLYLATESGFYIYTPGPSGTCR